MTAAEIEREFPTGDLFKLGAALAVGELLYEGLLQQQDTPDLRLFMESFGIKSMGDLAQLGLSNTYLADFEEMYAAA